MKKVPSGGLWAGLSCVVSSLLPTFLLKILSHLPEVSCFASKLSYPHRGAERFPMSKHWINNAPVDIFIGPSANCGRVGTLISPECYWFLPF